MSLCIISHEQNFHGLQKLWYETECKKVMVMTRRKNKETLKIKVGGKYLEQMSQYRYLIKDKDRSCHGLVVMSCDSHSRGHRF